MVEEAPAGLSKATADPVLSLPFYGTGVLLILLSQSLFNLRLSWSIMFILHFAGLVNPHYPES